MKKLINMKLHEENAKEQERLKLYNVNNEFSHTDDSG
jgi:hypothetical protein